MDDEQLLEAIREGGSVPIPYFDGISIRIEKDILTAEEVLPALKNLLSLKPEQRQADAKHLFAYCDDTIMQVGDYIIEEDMDGVEPTLDNIWDFVTVRELIFHKLEAGKYASTTTIFAVIEAEAMWEIDHGLLLSWADGNRLVRVSPFTGHPTNGNAAADPERDKFIYYSSSPEYCTYLNPQ